MGRRVGRSLEQPRSLEQLLIQSLPSTRTRRGLREVFHKHSNITVIVRYTAGTAPAPLFVM